MGNIYFDNVNISAAYSATPTGSGTFGAPARDVEAIEVPGRNGDIVIDHGRYSNIEVVYPCFINRNFAQNYQGLKSFLTSRIGYKRLEDDYHPGYYRMAYFASGIEPDMRTLNRAGSFELVFSCKPQKYLTSGETPVAMSASGAIFNPTLFEAKPIITVTGTAGGSGTISIGGKTLTISYIVNGMVLDSDEENARSADHASNYNNYVSGEFPVIPGGSQTVTITGAISALSIVPNWWEI